MRPWILLSALLLVFMELFAPARCQYFRDGDVRLVRGSYQWEGRVEVYMSGEWGTITDSDWTDYDARVVCRKLGHFKAGARAYSNAYFGKGQGSINLDSVQCSGSEYNLTECVIGRSGTGASHSMDVGVKCQPADGSYRNRDLRLVGGPHNWEGRVEIWNRTWGAISDNQWSTSDANVVCKQLKHSDSGAVIPCCNNYGVASGAILITDVVCTGSETRIDFCYYQMNTNSLLSHQYDVLVQCQEGNDTNEGDIRLVGGSNHWEGRVEVFLSREWGTVYDYYRAYTDEAQVVCRQLGYSVQGVRGRCCSVFGEGTGPIQLEYLYCGGGEFRLIDCDYNRDVFQTSYSHSLDWSVFCSIDGQDPWDIRLNGHSSGQLQVYLSEQWQPVANSSSTWTSNNSRVVCRELGFDPYPTDSSSYYVYNTYYPNLPVTTIDNVICSGDESSLQSCVHATTLLSSYPSVGVNCLGVDCSYGDMRLADGGTEAEGRVELCIDSRWGTVCDNRWNENSTAVACKHLGFSEIVNESRYFSSDKFGKGSGPVLIDYINCTGLEGSLWRWCNHFTHPSGCSHDSDVGVTCQPARCSDGQLRLTDTPEVEIGRVEICSHQRWNTFSTLHWFATNTRVACIELGFRGYGGSITSFGGGGGPRFNQYFKCTGSEPRLSECQSFNETASRSSGYDVGIYCSLAYCTDGELRLTEGGSDFEGRVEMCLSRRWGTIGGNGWTQTNSDVVCNALGYETTNEPANQSTPMAPSKPLHYHSIRCTRRDLMLLDCGFKKSSPYDYAEIEHRAIVKCKEPACGDGDLRLVGGNRKEEGRLEVCFGKRWGTIDGERWTHTDTEVACKQLGYSTSDVSYAITERQRHLLSQSLPTFMTLVGCYGSEERVVDCDYQDFRYSSSISPPTTTMDVSISCDIEESSAQASSVAMASLSISVILAVAVIALVAVLIALLVLQRRRKRRDMDLPHHSTHDPNTGGRYSSSGIAFSSKTERVAMDNKMAMEDLPAESYEEMDTSDPHPVPPRSQPKRPPNRARAAAPQKVDSSRYARGGHSGPTTGPKPQHHVQSRGQPRQPSPPSDLPEAIYECPDLPDEGY